MESYTKLFHGIVHSTIWDEPAEVRLVWITMLALADAHGEVHASVPGLAHAARVSLDGCRHALERLSSPDDESRSKEDGGRRIRAIDGGWFLINHEKYRDAGAELAVKAWNAKRARDWRAGKRSAQVAHGSATVAPLSASSASASAREEVSRAAHARAVGKSEHPGFVDWYAAYPRQISRSSAAKAYLKAIGKLGELAGQKRLLQTAHEFAEYCRLTARSLDKTPYPSTWLNQERWQDDYKEQAAAELKSSTETRHGTEIDHRAEKAAGEHPEPDKGPLPTL